MARSIVREGFIHSQNKQALKHIGTKEVLKGGLSENIQDLARGIGVYTNLSHNLTIVEGNFDTGVDEIRDFTRREMNRTGKAPLVIVDYLQIIKGKDKATTKESTDYIITELKRTSRALNIPLLAISSFNRNSYNSKVSYSSFKESGGIEYSCDVLMGMELSVMKELDLSKKGESDKNNARIEAEIQKTCRKVDLVILKNRNGSPFQRVSLDFYGKISLLNEC